MESAREDQKTQNNKNMNKYQQRGVDAFAQALSDEHTSVCEPFSSQLISTLKGMVKAEDHQGMFLGKFDLGYIPQKLHMIFLFFLRINRHVRSLHARNINLKADVIRYLMKDFVNLKEFTLSFATG